MSKEIVKLSGKANRFEVVETVFPQLKAVTMLDPASPMPSSFTEDWNERVSVIREAVKVNEGGAAERLATVVGVSNKVARFGARLNRTSFLLPAVVAEALVLFAPVGMIPFVDPASLEMVVAILGSSSLFFGSSMVGVVVSAIFDKILVPFKSSSVEYTTRVSRWAQERYGLQIGEAWGAPVGAVAEDIIYLGVKDGQKIYCFETEAGWIIGYRDGTELPVQVEQKELVRA